jgi:oxygen-independent coproporphyrinogen-3 oxidase
MSLDLIYARPRQTLAAWERELSEALTLARGHLSLYQLTIEPGTAYAALHRIGKLAIPDADHAAALYALTDEMTAAAGVPAYEISNYAAPGDESRHNLLYWRYGEYAGIGPGAHGRLIVDGTRRATVTERNPEAWRAHVVRDGHGRVEDHALDRDSEADEALLMGLRLVEGIDPARIAGLNGRVPSRSSVADLVASGHLAPVGADGRLRPTRDGRLVLDAVVLALSRALEPA